MKTRELLAYAAVFAIIIGLAMAVAGPGTDLGNAWKDYTGSTSNQVPAAGSSVVGGPSISAAKIDAILLSAGSPAAGSGQTFYQDSITYNIDNAYALALFHHESSYGTAGAATQTRSIGNIICTPGYSCIGRFRSYSSWSEGITDWYKLISGPEYAGGGLVTLDQIIPKYAPSSDGNSPASYIAAVQADVQAWRAA